MIRFPRLAIGSIHSHELPQPMSWALMAWFTAGGCQVQHFAARCCHNPARGAAAATGQSSRHLDTWLMSPELCRACFVRGFGESELAVIDGNLAASATDSEVRGGSLAVLCRWLNVPRIGVLDVELVERHGWPERPHVEAVALDRLPGEADWERWREAIESRWGLPVVGGLERLPLLRGAIAALSTGQQVPEAICRELAEQFGRFADRAALERLAQQRDFAASPTVAGEETSLAGAAAPVVAIAYDEAFHCYFPDMLDMLEALGATVVDFSPLRDERLPREADVVYIGCGNTIQYAQALAANHCMLSSLRSHLCHGKRLYADGGGLVYLCDYCTDAEGNRAPMVGALPAIGSASAEPPRIEPVEVTLADDCWLGSRGARLRGYRNSHWLLEPRGDLHGYLAETPHRFDLVGRYLALGSRLQLNFATRMDLLQGFVQPPPRPPRAVPLPLGH